MERYSRTVLNARFDRVALELLALLCIFGRKFFRLHHNIVLFRFFPRIAERSILNSQIRRRALRPALG